MAKQLLLFPDERPLVAALGAEFFRNAPDCPGVYLMRDSADEILYVGKAKNLRKRLATYRVANPDRIRRRHLRLLSSVKRIELHQCDSEASALAKEASLLRNLRPRFNRAGTWPSSPRYLTWRITGDTFNLAITETLDSAWFSVGPMGVAVFGVRNLLLRLIWCAAFPDRGLSGMPQGWFHGRCPNIITLPIRECGLSNPERLPELLANIWVGDLEPFESWLQTHAPPAEAHFEASIWTTDLQTLRELLSNQPATFNLQPATSLQFAGTGPKCAAHEA